MQFSLLYSTSGFVVFLYQVWGVSVLYFECFPWPLSLPHSEDWRCPRVCFTPFTFSSFECRCSLRLWTVFHCAARLHFPFGLCSLRFWLCWSVVIKVKSRARRVARLSHWQSAPASSPLSLLCQRSLQSYIQTGADVTSLRTTSAFT